MFTQIISLAALVVGYLYYSRFNERYAGMDAGRKTPAHPGRVK